MHQGWVRSQSKQIGSSCCQYLSCDHMDTHTVAHAVDKYSRAGMQSNLPPLAVMWAGLSLRKNGRTISTACLLERARIQDWAAGAIAPSCRYHDIVSRKAEIWNHA